VKSGDVHRLAVKALERSLALSHPGEGGSLLAHRLGLVQAFVDLGVISAEGMHDWRERFERASQALEPVSAKSRARAVELLERELARAASASETFDPLGPRESFLAKLQALLETGHIDWRDRSAWVEKLDEVAPEPPSRPAAPPYDGAELRAVIVGPERRLGGLRINSAEVYDDCVIVRWHLVVDEDDDWRAHVATPDHADDLARAHGPRALEDDAGTSYTLGPAGIFGMWSVLHVDQRPAVIPNASAFTPGPPTTATRLSVACAAGAVELRFEDAAR